MLWLIVFIGGAVFQLWRGSPVDTLVYSVAAVLVILSIQTRFKNFHLSAPRPNIVVTALLLCTLVFLLFPIHSWPTSVCYLLLVPILLKVVLRTDSPPEHDSTSALRRSSKIWFGIGSLTCICELGNYFASDITHDDKSFPTLTVLVDPFVADKAGKVIFILLWTAIGVGLFRVAAAK